MMGTRSGDLDPAIVTHLTRKENWSADEVERFLNTECGFDAIIFVATQKGLTMTRSASAAS